MNVRNLDSSGDWLYGQGLGSYATGQAAIALDIAMRLKSIRGDCFFATAFGVDYHNLLEKGQQQNLLIALQNAVLQTPGVVKIVSFPFSFNAPKRSLAVGPIQVQSIYGQVFVAQLNNLLGGNLSA